MCPGGVGKRSGVGWKPATCGRGVIRGLVPHRHPRDNETSVLPHRPHPTPGPWLHKHYQESLLLSFDQHPPTFPRRGPGATRMNWDKLLCKAQKAPRPRGVRGREGGGSWGGGGLHLSLQPALPTSPSPCSLPPNSTHLAGPPMPLPWLGLSLWDLAPAPIPASKLLPTSRLASLEASPEVPFHLPPLSPNSTVFLLVGTLVCTLPVTGTLCPAHLSGSAVGKFFQPAKTCRNIHHRHHHR